MNINDVAIKLRDMGRKPSDKVLIIETINPVFTHFDGKKAKTTHTFNTHFVLGTTAYINARPSRRGYRVSSVFPYGTDFKTVYWKSKDTSNKKTYSDLLRKRYDGMTWTSLTAESIKSPMGFEYPKYRNISKDFSESQMNQIREAFRNKTNIHISKRGTQRDLSVSTQFDGKEFKAWFSSEYAGTGNGDYYLLLNPTLAVYYEAD